MTSPFDSELPDYLLLAYLDGEADEEISAHIATCGECQTRLQALNNLQGHLTTTLYRVECPEPHLLGEYDLRLLPPNQHRAIVTHLNSCPYCPGELEQLRHFLSDLKPEREMGMGERIKILIASLLPQPGASGFGAPAFAGVRGTEDEPLIYQAENVQVVLEVQDDIQQPDRKTLLGLVMGLDAATDVSLWRGDEAVATGAVDELGNFAFSGLVGGEYELVVSGTETELHIPSLAV